MTTVVMDKRCGLYAHDGLIAEGSAVVSTNTEKVLVLDTSSKNNNTEITAIGGCGDIAAIKAVYEYLEHLEYDVRQVEYDVRQAVNFVREKFPDAEFNLAIMVSNENGRKLFEVCDSLPMREFEGDYLAIGSGRHFALAAMDAGCTVKEAVEIACNRDVFSGGTVVSGGIG